MNMSSKVLFLIIIIITVSPFLSHQGSATRNIVPTGRFYIDCIEAPDTMMTGENFTVTIAVKNDRFLPIKGAVKINLLDGLLETLQKDIGGSEEIVFRGRTTTYLTFNCTIREGDANWYKEEYNIEAVLLQRRPILGWVTRDVSTIKGVHVVSPLWEKDKIHLVCFKAPEIIAENQSIFETMVCITNKGSIPLPVWARVDIVEKTSIFPEFEEYNILQGLASERKEIGRSNEVVIPAGATESLSVRCYLRESEMKKTQFMIQSVLFVNISGVQYQVDKTTLQSIVHEESFIKKYSMEMMIGVFLVLIALLLVVVIIRLIYPAYVIKRIKVQEERRRLEKKKRL